jgi:hypothetical protein
MRAKVIVGVVFLVAVSFAIYAAWLNDGEDPVQRALESRVQKSDNFEVLERRTTRKSSPFAVHE